MTNTSLSAIEADFEWLLKVDVESTIKKLLDILAKCSASFVTESKNYNLFHCGQNQLDVIKINTTIEGFKIINADINIKLTSKHPSQTIKTCIKETPTNPFCWRLHQIQDTLNHMSLATDLLTSTPLRMTSDGKHEFKSAEEVTQLIDSVMFHLQRSRSSLLAPRKQSIEELQHSQNMQSIRPAMPLDYTINFNVQANRLVCSVYHLALNHPNGAQIKAEYRADTDMPHLAEILEYMTLGLQTCQQLKEKLQALS